MCKTKIELNWLLIMCPDYVDYVSWWTFAHSNTNDILAPAKIIYGRVKRQLL